MSRVIEHLLNHVMAEILLGVNKVLFDLSQLILCLLHIVKLSTNMLFNVPQIATYVLVILYNESDIHRFEIGLQVDNFIVTQHLTFFEFLFEQVCLQPIDPV